MKQFPRDTQNSNGEVMSDWGRSPTLMMCGDGDGCYFGTGDGWAYGSEDGLGTGYCYGGGDGQGYQAGHEPFTERIM